LLQLQGINIDNEDNLIKPSQETLIFTIDLREKILENKKELKAIKKLLNKKIILVSESLIKKQHQTTIQNLIKAKYLNKIITDLKNLNI
jgi:hypothetical protein